MSSTITQEKQQVLKQFQQTTSTEEAQAKIAIFPVVMAYEARFALQQLKEHVDPQLLAETLEPLAIAVGWAEGLAYVFDRQAAGSVGAQVPVGNGRQGRS